LVKFTELHNVKVYYKGNGENFILKTVLVIEDAQKALCTIAESFK